MELQSQDPNLPIKKKNVGIKALLVVALVLGLLLTVSIILTVSRPKTVTYYQENFKSGLAGWKAQDAEWKTDIYDRTGVARLQRKEFVSPYLMAFLPLKQSPPETLVFHFTVRVHAFSDDAMTLATLYFPMGPLAIVTNQDGKLGVAEDLFSVPEYSKSVGGSLSKDKWEDIYVYISNADKKLRVYRNSNKIIEKKWDKPSYPVQEIWLGSIWIKGGGNYGAPMDVCYDEVQLGNEGILPKPFPFNILK